MLTFNPDAALRMRVEHMLSTAHQPDAAMFERLMTDMCERLSIDRSNRATSIRALIAAGAWTDAALSLIDAEIPQWQLRRLSYDEGEWYCALSRQRDLPNWLDDAVEAHHPNRAIALLLALIDVKTGTAAISPARRVVAYETVMGDGIAVCCENFS